MLTPPPNSLPKRGKRSSVPESASGGKAFLENLGLPPLHIGIDEAGRGCLAGPVIAAAALFPVGYAFAERLPGLDDSKKLTETRRNALSASIRREALACGLGLSWQDEVDSVNIRNATFRAMARAVLDLYAEWAAAETAGWCAPDEPSGSAPTMLPSLVIDGNAVITSSAWESCVAEAPLPGAPWESSLPFAVPRRPSLIPQLSGQKAVVDGDALVPAISAASILAKTARDALMARLDEVFPGYGLRGHKGYGTKEHLAAITEKGPCALHRRTFRGVRPEQEQLRLMPEG